MKIAVCGGFGHLGSDIVTSCLNKGYEVRALDLKIKDTLGKYEASEIDVTNKDTLKGKLDGCDAVITTIGLVTKSDKFTNYDIDLDGNLNILEEAKKAGVKKFVYVSVIHADSDATVPMLDAKLKFENKLKESGIEYIIIRPSGYFYDIAHVFTPMIEKGKVNLLKGPNYKANVIDTPDLADFIVEHITESNKTYEVGGKETYTFEEMAKLFFEAANKKVKISKMPVRLFDMLIKSVEKKNKQQGGLLRFSKWTMTHDMVGEPTGKNSFKEYVFNLYKDKGEK